MITQELCGIKIQVNFMNNFENTDIDDIFLKNRIVCINGEINQENTREWITSIVELEKDKVQKPIKLMISSNGGDVYSMLGLIDILESCRKEIHTACVGLVASCSADLFIIGKVRYMTQNSTIMIHDVARTFFDSDRMFSYQIKDEFIELTRLHNIFTNLYLNKINMKKSTIEKLHKKESYLDCNQALKLNIATDINFNIFDWFEKT